MVSGEGFKKRVLERMGEGVKPHTWRQSHGIDRGVIQRLMQGKIPDPDNLVQLARELDVSVDWLLTGEERPQGREGILNEEDRQFLRIVHSLTEEDKKSWMRMGLLLSKNPTGGSAPSASGSAQEKIEKSSKKV